MDQRTRAYLRERRKLSGTWKSVPRTVAGLIEVNRMLLNRLMAYVRMVRRTMKATSLYSGARRLAEAGRTKEAFDLTKQALDSLPERDPSGGDPSPGLLVVWTVFYAELAAKLGRPADAHDAVRRALRLATPPFSENPKIQPYITWLRHQLADDSRA